YTTADGLGVGGARDLFVDSDDVLWCVTDAGISRFDPNTFASLRKPDGLIDKEHRTPSAFAIEPDGQGAYWIGTEWCRLYRLETHGGDRVSQTGLAPSSYVRHVRRAADGTLWLGNFDGIYHYVDERLNRVLERSWIIAFDR